MSSLVRLISEELDSKKNVTMTQKTLRRITKRRLSLNGNSNCGKTTLNSLLGKISTRNQNYKVTSCIVGSTQNGVVSRTVKVQLLVFRVRTYFPPARLVIAHLPKSGGIDYLSGSLVAAHYQSNIGLWMPKAQTNL